MSAEATPPTVVLVTTRWELGEPGVVMRLVAGAAALDSAVEVVAVGTSSGGFEHDGVFRVHRVVGAPTDLRRAAVVRAALSVEPSSSFPAIAGPLLANLSGGHSKAVLDRIVALDPDVVVVTGTELATLASALRHVDLRSRIVWLPLCGADPALGLPELVALADEVQAIGVVSGLEARSVPRPTLRLDVALAVNRSAAEGVMLGMSNFDRFVVLLTGFPPGSPGGPNPGIEYVLDELGDIAVVVVAHDRWLVRDASKALTVPVRPSRVNLWRLFSHAEVVIDLRPQGIVSREIAEALLFGTPVVVPEATVAAEYAQDSGGGLWYSGFPEMFAAARAVLGDAGLRASLSTQARAWAQEMRGNQARFGEQVARLVHGP